MDWISRKPLARLTVALVVGAVVVTYGLWQLVDHVMRWILP